MNLKVTRFTSCLVFISSLSFIASCNRNNYKVTFESKTLSFVRDNDDKNNYKYNISIKDSDDLLVLPNKINSLTINKINISEDKYTYSKENKTLIIPNNIVNGDIYISAEAVHQYSSFMNSTSLDLSNKEFIEDIDYDAKLKFKTETSYNLYPNKLEDISINGVKLKDDEYNYDPKTGNIHIDKTKIKGDLVISAEKDSKKNYSYQVIFNHDSHSKVYVYGSKDYSIEPTLIDFAYSVNGDTGELIKDGSGQVNFKVEVDKGYDLDCFWPIGLYGDLKDPAEVKHNDTYRITKVRNNLNVRITTKKLYPKNVSSYTDWTTNKTTIKWDINSPELIQNYKVDITSNGSTDTKYVSDKEFITDELNENQLYEFTITPIMLDNTEGSPATLSKYLDKNTDLVDFPRVELTTKDNVDPIIHESKNRNNDMYAKYVKSGVNIYNNQSSTYSCDVGEAKVKVRGNLTSKYNKKPYKIKLSTPADLLSFIKDPSDTKDYTHTDWVLIAPNLGRQELTETTDILKNAVGYKLSSIMGFDWSPRFSFVKLYLNNDYKGIYMLAESTGRGNGTGDDQSRYKIEETGYIVERDYFAYNEDISFTSKISTLMNYSFKYPDTDTFNEESKVYKDISNEINNIEDNLLNSASYADICNLINIDSYAKWLLFHDILLNSDPMGSNMFEYKKSSDDTLVNMGTPWDFDGIFYLKDRLAPIRSPKWSKYYYLTKYDEFNALVKNLFINNYSTYKTKIDNYLDSLVTGTSKTDFNNLLSKEQTRWKVSKLYSIEDQVDDAKSKIDTQITYLINNLPS